jgi:hypothetical protein
MVVPVVSCGGPLIFLWWFFGLFLGGLDGYRLVVLGWFTLVVFKLLVGGYCWWFFNVLVV